MKSLNEFFYTLIRAYADSRFKLAYSRVEIVGLENVPKDGAVIFAPNHTNALMDALAVSQISVPPIVYVARADMFRKPLLAKMLNFIKMMPIARMRDGISSLKRDAEIMERAVVALKSGLAFCIMAEGTQRAKHSLLPLVKGIFRIALQADESMGSEKPVYIVPMGIEYGDYFRFRSTVLLQIGKPLCVTDIVRAHSDLGKPELINLLRQELAEAMKQLILYIPVDDRYEAVLELTTLLNREQCRLMGCSDYLLKNRLEASRKIVECCSTNTAEVSEMLDKANYFAEERKRLKISEEVVRNPDFSKFGLAESMILLILLFPYFVFSAVITSPVTLMYNYLCAKMKDVEFNNTIRFAVTAIMAPFWLITIILVVGLCVNWWWSVVITVLAVPAHSFLHDYLHSTRILLSKIKSLRNKKLRNLIIQLNSFYLTLQK
jgi:1-acyl-sn-glycerol-3-phosphate acyltransferase